MKLGKLAARRDPRTLRLAKYMPAALPAIPAAMDLSPLVPSWGMMRNDELGDCTCAAAGHLLMQWTAAAGKPFSPSDADIVAAYSAITGYTPDDPSTDRGAVEIDVLNFWKARGIAGHRIGGYAAVNHLDHAHVRAAAYLFGGVYIGVALPVCAQNQNVWDVPGRVAKFFEGDDAPGSWGGHAVEVVAYDAEGVTVVTWGALKRMTWAFWDKYVDEAYAVLSQDFVNGQGKTPEGFNLAELAADLLAVAG
jgi:hypothetical protein